MREKKTAELLRHGMLGRITEASWGRNVPWPTMHHDLLEYVSSQIILEARMKNPRRQGNGPQSLEQGLERQVECSSSAV
jgi:hypothetical protein